VAVQAGKPSTQPVGKAETPVEVTIALVANRDIKVLRSVFIVISKKRLKRVSLAAKLPDVALTHAFGLGKGG